MWKALLVVLGLSRGHAFENQFLKQSGTKPSISPRFYSVSDPKSDDYNEYHPNLEMWTKAVVRQKNEDDQRFQQAMLNTSPNFYNILTTSRQRFQFDRPWNIGSGRMPITLLNPYNRPQGMMEVPRLSPGAPMRALYDTGSPLERPKNDKILTMDELSAKPYTAVNPWSGPDMIDGFNFKALKALQSE